jgi:hypothetical protein
VATLFSPNSPEKTVVELVPMLSAKVVESELAGCALYDKLIVKLPSMETVEFERVAAKKANPVIVMGPEKSVAEYDC